MVNGNAFTEKYYYLSIAKTVFNLKKIVGCLVKNKPKTQIKSEDKKVEKVITMKKTKHVQGERQK